MAYLRGVDSEPRLAGTRKYLVFSPQATQTVYAYRLKNMRHSCSIVLFHFAAVFQIKKCVAYDWLTIRPSELLNNEAVIIIHVYFGQHSPLKKKKKKNIQEKKQY